MYNGSEMQGLPMLKFISNSSLKQPWVYVKIKGIKDSCGIKYS